MKDKTISYANRINALVVQISDAAVKTLDADDEDDWRLQAFGRGIEGYIEAAFAEERSRIEELEAAMTTIRDWARPRNGRFRMKSKRERLTLIVNTVDAALKGTEDD